ncbi:MAG TPA: NAD-dependent epimerase/dehydratase family protein [Dokdonella sp.]|uniref:NAD-dependent epimerase/dehydratase family protein n=1 Tax=Dokdonella sp. TaxID=2291710 RepID=UPI002D7F7F3F|nr:NAD-dependent epimerase/dehydratase family protein [Dokdonella sp.]HET9032558.1 NAD-dependent epimerase/dehydratase family protein [Dokdonella sp.]
MLRTLVIGASGQIGRALIPRLLDSGHQVFALSRFARVSTRNNLTWLRGDIFTAMPSLPALDVIFSLGPLNGFAEWLATASLDRQPRVVAFGSMSAESKRESEDPAERALAQTLRHAERTLVEAAQSMDINWTLLRPTLIYGGGQDRSLTRLAQFGARWRVFPRVPAAKGLRQPVHVDDLASACVAAITRVAASRRKFDLGGGERLSVCDMLDRVRHSLPGPILPVPVPLFAARGVLGLTHLNPRWRHIGVGAVHRLRNDLLADDEDAKRLLDWAPRSFCPLASTWNLPAKL